MRDYWRSEANATALAPRLVGSPDAFNRRGRQPWSSVNFLTAHDGFTLNDTVSYNEKHNDANGEGNRDGHSHNRSWNHGVEGPTDDPAVNDLRERQMKNLLATLLLSQGTPMLLAGDEFARTQQGNNNAYCQDNEISWVDWNYGERGERLIAFTRDVIGLRHKFPILRRVRWLTGQFDAELEVKDLEWINANGSPMEPGHWDDAGQRCFGLLLDGRAPETGVRRRGELATLMLILNAWHESVPFKLPEPPGGSGWTLLLDTVRPDLPEGERFDAGHTYDVTGRSLLLFQLD